jgi:hypothetical protein
MNPHTNKVHALSLPGVEWAVVAPGQTIIATSENAWAGPHILGGPFSKPMTGPGCVSTTRNLLDGAARAGWATEERAPEPPLTVARWAWRLCGFHHTTHATPPLMREAAERFSAAGRHTLARWAQAKAREEQGHDTLALRDLRALGVDAEAAVAARVPRGPASLVRYLERQVRGEDPIGCVGYAYALERLALEFDGSYIARIEASLPRGVRATRCLRVHSAEGSDPRHVQEIVELVAGLPPRERTAVARTCHEAAVLCRESSSGERLAEEAVQRLLEPFFTRGK